MWGRVEKSSFTKTSFETYDTRGGTLVLAEAPPLRTCDRRCCSDVLVFGRLVGHGEVRHFRHSRWNFISTRAGRGRLLGNIGALRRAEAVVNRS